MKAAEGSRAGVSRRTVMAGLAIIVTVVLAVVAAWYLSMSAPPPTIPAKVYSGQLSSFSNRTSFRGKMQGPAHFDLQAIPRLGCFLAINNTTAYSSECRSFMYEYGFVETLEFTLEIEIRGNLTISAFTVTIGAKDGLRNITTSGYPPVVASNTVLEPQVGLRSECQSPWIEVHQNVTLTPETPSKDLLLRVPQCAHLEVHGSLKISLTMKIHTVVVVKGDECRGVTDIIVYRAVSYEIEYEFHFAISNLSEILGPERYDLGLFGPGVSIT